MPRLEVPVINHLESSAATEQQSRFIFATRNPGKLREYERLLGQPVIGIDLKVPEIQGNPEAVLRQKAIDAWDVNGGKPIYVEDTSLDFKAFNGTVASFADQLTSVTANRELLCKALTAEGVDRRVVFQVGLAVYDGREPKEPHMRIGQWPCTVAEAPRGTNGFGFDDMIIPDGQVASDGSRIPDGQGKTYAEMTDEEKDRYSPRRLALEALLREQPDLQTPIFQMSEPYLFQQEAVQAEVLASDERSVQHAFNLEAIAGNTPNSDFKVTTFPTYHEIAYGKVGASGRPELVRILPNIDSPSIGLIITAMDTVQNVNGKSLRLRTDEHGNITLWQMGPESVRMALAARALEFSLYHNEETYAQVREMMANLKAGKRTTVERSNTRSAVIEKLIEMAHTLPKGMDEDDAWDQIGAAGKLLEQGASEEEVWRVLGTAAIKELGYARESSDRELTRQQAAKGLMLDSTGLPSDLFAIGGMPPVSGWKDVVTTAALSFKRIYLSHNSVFADDVDAQIRLFTAAKDDIQALHLPQDIEEICIAQIGACVGSRNPQQTLEDVRKMKAAGISTVRIYTTNPDARTVATVQAIHDEFGDDMTICVGPIVDMPQAKKLVKAGVKILYAGHGGGENCTSLSGGGAANSLELAYRMSIDPDFNNVAIGLEGGTGSAIGAILGFVDVISLNRRGVAGGIELGGVFVEDAEGHIVQPYHGTASPPTQWTEIITHPGSDIAKRRLDAAGRLRNVEGVPNYMRAEKHIHSVTDRWHEVRMLAGRTLADQDSLSLNELREHIATTNYANHRGITTDASEIAGHHRNDNK